MSIPANDAVTLPVVPPAAAWTYRRQPKLESGQFSEAHVPVYISFDPGTGGGDRYQRWRWVRRR